MRVVYNKLEKDLLFLNFISIQIDSIPVDSKSSFRHLLT